MTVERDAETIRAVAAAHGESLTLDVCRHIARELALPRLPNLRPGEIAQKHRHRYEGEPDESKDEGWLP
jgi:hypothetical protein